MPHNIRNIYVIASAASASGKKLRLWQKTTTNFDVFCSTTVFCSTAVVNVHQVKTIALESATTWYSLNAKSHRRRQDPFIIGSILAPVEAPVTNEINMTCVWRQVFMEKTSRDLREHSETNCLLWVALLEMGKTTEFRNLSTRHALVGSQKFIRAFIINFAVSWL